jgi:endoglucanase
VRTSSGVKSPTFVIHDSVYVPVWKSSLKGFFFQRCGTSLPVQQAGVYYHPICHTLDGTFHVTAESSGTINSIGGWHDAGDYGKYVVNAGVTVGTLLLAYEMFPDRFAADDIGIPESGNRIPDILDETRVELEWLLTMQASSGGVFTKITHPLFEGFIMPQSDVGGRYIYRISSAATGDFAAMLARASRVYKAFDQQFSQRCLAAAVRAWQFLEKSPSIVPPGGFRNPTGTVTGEYGDGDDSDERLWAAAELLATTKETKYKTYYSLYYSRKGLLNKTMSWPDLTALAHLTYLTADFTGKDSTIMRDLKSSLQSFCQTYVNRRNNSGFCVSLVPGEFNWGSNSAVLNNAILLIAGFEMLRDLAYRDVALEQMHYILGVNPVGTSYLTGLGTKRPMFPHHRPSGADNILEPVPGLLAGGANQYLQDDVLKARFSSSTPPALCYADDQGSYASNEICINWNAPMVFVAGYFAYFTSVTGVGLRDEILPSTIYLEQNYPNPFNPLTRIRFSTPERGVVRLRVFDGLGREVALLVNEELPAGMYERAFDASVLCSGVYFYRLESSGHALTRKLVLVK